MKDKWQDIRKDGIVPVWTGVEPLKSECPKCQTLSRVYKNTEKNRWYILCRKVHGWIELKER